jgi:hypothetical protein
LQTRRGACQANIPDPYLHTADRSLGVYRIARNRLLHGCFQAASADRRVACHLAVDHRADQQNAEHRCDRKLGADPHVLDDPHHIILRASLLGTKWPRSGYAGMEHAGTKTMVNLTFVRLRKNREKAAIYMHCARVSRTHAMVLSGNAGNKPHENSQG